MAYLPAKLAQNRQASTAETTVYTVPAGIQTIVKQAVLSNTTSSSATYSISLVPSGGSAGDDNRIMKAQSLPANSTTTIDVAQVLSAGDFISILQGTSGAVAITVSGVEFSDAPAAIRAIQTARRTAGDLTLNSTTWADVDTGLDLTLAARAGDTVEVGVSGVVSNNAVVVGFDAATIVSSTAQNVVSSGAAESASSEGVMAWRPGESQNSNFGGGVLYTLKTGDIDSGSTTLRLRFRTATASNKTLLANSNQPLAFWAINHGVAASTPAVTLQTVELTADSSVGFTPSSPASDTVVPGVSIVVGASRTARTAVVSSAIAFTKTNSLRFKVYLDGSAIWPSITNGSRETSITDATNQKIWTGAGILAAIPGDNATHTVEVRAQASGDTNAATFHHRTLVLQLHPA